MRGSRREPASNAGARFRAKPDWFPKARTPVIALGSGIAVLAISAVAYAANAHLLTPGHNFAPPANRTLCGAAHKLPKPLAPQVTLQDRNSSGVRGLAFCYNGSFLAAADGNGLVYLWSMSTHRTAWTLHDPRSRGVNA